MIDTCVELYPEDAIFLNDKGYLKSYSGDFEGAVELFLKAREIRPDDMMIVINKEMMRHLPPMRKKPCKECSPNKNVNFFCKKFLLS